MKTRSVLRLAGASAALGGALRVAAAFIPPAQTPELELLYFVIDAALLLGLIGIYASDHERMGWFGLIGFVIAAIGQASIVGPDDAYHGINTYEAGVAAIAIGLAVMSVAMLVSGRFPRFIPALWIGSLLAGLSSSILPIAAAPAFLVAGLLFAAAFLAAGIYLSSSASD